MINQDPSQHIGNHAGMSQVCLDIFKSGQTVGRIPLHRQSTLFGRAADVVDEALEHESISRKHAKIFHEGYATYIIDLGSAHGTFVNKTKLSPNVRFQLSMGTELRFGASTRSYVFQQPAHRAANDHAMNAYSQSHMSGSDYVQPVFDENTRFRYRTTVIPSDYR